MDALTSPEAKLEHVYERLDANSPPHGDAPLRPAVSASPARVLAKPAAAMPLAEQAGLLQQAVATTDLNIFAGGSAAEWLTKLSSSISELEGIATPQTPSRTPAKPRRSSSRPAPPPRDAHQSPTTLAAASP
eukprot:COSAG06_NODE_13970_length_1201_cov_1.214156_1_plen_131_part_10